MRAMLKNTDNRTGFPGYTCRGADIQFRRYSSYSLFYSSLRIAMEVVELLRKKHSTALRGNK